MAGRGGIETCLGHIFFVLGFFYPSFYLGHISNFEALSEIVLLTAPVLASGKRTANDLDSHHLRSQSNTAFIGKTIT